MPRSILGLGVALLVLMASPLLAQLRDAEVTFAGAGDLKLKGTLVLPDAEGPHPALLLLPGSGPTDRDGNQHPVVVTDLLKQIAELLAAEGVATLRFDKRAVRHYASHWPRQPDAMDEYFAWENFVADARAGLEFLHAHVEVDPARVAIAGHSEGGLIALQLGRDLAGTPQAPAGLILLATAGRTLDVVLREQVAASLERNGAGALATRELLAHTDAAIQTVKAREPLPADLPRDLQPLFNPTVLRILHSYFTIDPATLARSVQGPVLIVQGAEDMQVSVERDAPRLNQALQQRDDGTVQLIVVPGASHNLKEGARDPHGFRGPIAEPVAAAIIEWVQKHLKRAAPDLDAPDPLVPEPSAAE